MITYIIPALNGAVAMTEVEQMIRDWSDPQQQKYGLAFLAYLKNPASPAPSGRGCPDADFVRRSVRAVFDRVSKDPKRA